MDKALAQEGRRLVTHAKEALKSSSELLRALYLPGLADLDGPKLTTLSRMFMPVLPLIYSFSHIFVFVN